MKLMIIPLILLKKKSYFDENVIYFLLNLLILFYEIDILL